MAKNPFVVLGVSENCTQNELYEAYKKERAKYADLRFEPGEKGAEACARLEEIEEAYAEANEKLRSNFDISYTGNDLSDADRAIKEGKLDEAQNILDNCQNRTAEWHYLQSAIFYRKNWTADALKQLEYACQMDPTNTKYSQAKQAMVNHIKANSRAQQNSFYNGDNKEERTYVNMNNSAPQRGCSACDCCSSLICADCCCECMGGDLISCC